MVRDKNGDSTNELPSTDLSESDQVASDEEDADSSVSRRDYLKVAGAGALAIGGLGLGSAAGAASGPDDSSNWQLAFEDTFDSGSLDSSKWGVGYGWGLENGSSRERIVAENVSIRDGKLRLAGTHDGEDYKSGAVNTKDKATFGPGTYFEAKIKMPKREGFLPAFWSKPNSEAWPPELDFVELFQDGDGWDDISTSAHSVHYTTSTEPGDGSTYDHSPSKYDAGVDLTQDFHVYGCKWMSDRIVHYVDGQKVAERTDPTILESLANGAPFYMMLNTHIDKIGTTDPSESWGEALVADWVRAWEYAPDSTESTDDGTTDDSTTDDGTTDDSTTDSDTTEDTEHYFWVQTADGSPATYAFEASGGNIRIDGNEQDDGEDDEWVSSDGTTAGGTVAEGTSNYDGFWYVGEITDLKYSGPLLTYIDDQQVDPSTLVDSSEPGPNQPDADGTNVDGSSLPKTVTIDGRNVSEPTGYSLTVSDSIEATDRINDNDTIDGQTAEGQVNGGIDEYAFDGRITDLRVDGAVEVYVDGERVNLLTVERAADSKSWVKYLIETTGRCLRAEVPGASANSQDKIRGAKVHGQVYSGTDAYWLFGGDVVDVSTFGGNVVTTLDGTEADYTD